MATCGHHLGVSPTEVKVPGAAVIGAGVGDETAVLLHGVHADGLDGVGDDLCGEGGERGIAGACGTADGRVGVLRGAELGGKVDGGCWGIRGGLGGARVGKGGGVDIHGGWVWTFTAAMAFECGYMVVYLIQRGSKSRVSL